MKTILFSLILFCSALRLNAQLYKEAKPVYEAALSVLQSDFAKQQFPAKTVKLVMEDNLPDTITVDDNRLYNFGTFMRGKKGKVEAQHIPTVLKIINSDSNISREEKALLDAVKNSHQITIYSTQASNKGFAVNLVFDAEPEAKQLLENFYDKGVAINSLQNMHSAFVDAQSIDIWLEYYYGNTEQKELALAFMHYKILELSAEKYSDYDEYTKRYKSFIRTVQLQFSRRDESVYPEASRNLVLSIIKEFDESGYISLPDFLYTDAMKK